MKVLLFIFSFGLLFCSEAKPEKKAPLCKVYVISLERTPDRLAFIKEQLDKLGIEFEHFIAVDGKQVTLTDIDSGEKFLSKDIDSVLSKKTKSRKFLIQHRNYKEVEFVHINKRRMLSPGEAGCFLSHRAVLADIVKHGYKRAVIFEDDVQFFENFGRDFPIIVKNIPSDADIFFLDIGMNKPYASKTYFVSAGFWLRSFFNTNSPYYAGIKKTRAVWGMHAYSVTCETAKKILKSTECVDDPIDTAIMDNNSGLKFYVSKIKLLSAGALESEIQKMGGR